MGDIISGMSGNNESPCSKGSDCSKFNKLIHSMIDGEISKTDIDFFEKHADDCVHCLEHYGAEKEFVREIKTKLARRCCPDSLLLKIKNKIEELK